jgi:hypothetical protein
MPSLSQAFTTHHPNVFTPILSLSEGRAGIAWVPSNKMLFFLLRYKAPLVFPQMFSLYFYSYTILSDSLSLFIFKELSPYTRGFICFELGALCTPINTVRVVHLDILIV